MSTVTMRVTGLVIVLLLAMASSAVAEPTFQQFTGGQAAYFLFDGGRDVTGDGVPDTLLRTYDGEAMTVRVAAGGGRTSWVLPAAEADALVVAPGPGLPGTGPMEPLDIQVLPDVSGDGVDELLVFSIPAGESREGLAVISVVYGGPADAPLRVGQVGERGFEVALDASAAIDVLEDVDGRGSPGFVVSARSESSQGEPVSVKRVYRVVRPGVLQVWAEFTAKGLYTTYAAGDVDGDGRTDMVFSTVVGETVTVTVVRMPASESTEIRAVEDLPESQRASDELFGGCHGREGCTVPDPYARGVGDVNGDGFDDIGFGIFGVQANLRYTTTNIRLGQPFRLEPARRISIPNRAAYNDRSSLTPAGDLDGDGYDEVFLGNVNDGRDLYVLYGGDVRPDGEFSEPRVEIVKAPLEFPVRSVGPEAVRGGDVDGDGRSDILTPGAGLRSLLLIAGRAGVPAPTGVAFDGLRKPVGRVVPETATAAAASVAVSQRVFPGGGADYVVVARDDKVADALAATSLTGGGPLLLTPGTKPDETVLKEMSRVLDPGSPVYLIGGAEALGEVVESSVNSYFEPVRVAGASRVETAVEVARLVAELNGPVGEVAVARAYGTEEVPSAAWVDSVAAGGWAAATGTPILLTDGPGLHPAVAAAVAELGVGSSVVLGGSAAVSAEAAAALPGPRRVAGAERAATAVAVADELWPGWTSRRVLVNGFAEDGWVFGLPAAALSADADAPVLLTDRDSLPGPTAAALAGCTLDVLLVGGEEAISGAGQDAVTRALGCP